MGKIRKHMNHYVLSKGHTGQGYWDSRFLFLTFDHKTLLHCYHKIIFTLRSNIHCNIYCKNEIILKIINFYIYKIEKKSYKYKILYVKTNTCLLTKNNIDKYKIMISDRIHKRENKENKLVLKIDTL